LAAERQRTERLVADLEAELADVVSAQTDVATDDEHDPEGATIAFERARIGALLDQARSRLDSVNRALQRSAAGTYGICERCGGPVGAERLAARPATTVCIACA
jgi:RNA polymerase-binding transcription factor DksA